MYNEFTLEWYQKIWLDDFFQNICENRKEDFIQLRNEFETLNSEFSEDDCKKEICDHFYPELLDLISCRKKKQIAENNMQKLSYNFYQINTKKRKFDCLGKRKLLIENYLFKIVVYNDFNDLKNIVLLGKVNEQILELYQEKTGKKCETYIDLRNLDLFDVKYNIKKINTEYDIIFL